MHAQPQRRRRKRRARRSPSASGSDEEQTLGARRRALLSAADASAAQPAVELPVGVLCRVLTLACADGAVPTAARAACVCRAWRAAVALCEAELWRRADLSYGWCRATDGVVLRLCRRDAWAQLAHVNLTGCGKLTDAALDALLAACPQLVSLDVSDTRSFSAAALLRLAQTRRLRALGLARASLRPHGEFDKSLRGLLAAAAPSLAALSLAGCARVSSATVRGLLCLRELTALDLTGAGVPARAVTVPVEALQEACPLLRELRLSGLGLDGGFTAPAPPPAQPPGAGFAHLCVCELASGSRMTSHGAVPSVSAVDDALLLRILRTSDALRELAVGGTPVTAAGLAALPALALSRLLVANSAAACDDGARVASARWSHSLQDVDFAGGGAAVTDAAALALAECAHLTACDLSATSVARAGLRALVLRRGASLTLHVAGCRELERGVRRAALLGASALLDAVSCS
jgi:F-box/leucine-rich repeat protein 6